MEIRLRVWVRIIRHKASAGALRAVYGQQMLGSGLPRRAGVAPASRSKWHTQKLADGKES